MCHTEQLKLLTKSFVLDDNKMYNSQAINLVFHICNEAIFNNDIK